VINSIHYDVILLTFLFFFLGGYLLYAALFAAVGAAVDTETDTQQFMMPITIPLFLGFIIANMAIYDPDGQLAVWFSMIPFTSPVVMMARIPFGVPVEQIWISGALLIIGFVFTTWFAARIYRTGILMYGKKVSYRELWKWLRYRS
jgi:ABC-2 type transport system permease protein